MNNKIELTFNQFYELFIERCDNYFHDHTGNYIMHNGKFKFPIFNKLYFTRIVLHKCGFWVEPGNGNYSFSKDLDKKILILL